MRFISKLARAGALALAATAILAGPASAAPSHQRAGAVFVQTDDPSGNTVVAYDRAGDGSLRAAGSYETGGLGGVLAGSVVDHLASQGSLAYDRDRRLLYAVYVQAGTAGIVDAFRIAADGSLTSIGSVTVPGAAGGEGIAAN